MVFTRIKVGMNVQLTFYRNNPEKVNSFHFFGGVYFDSRLTWREHIMRIIGKVLYEVMNVMRCLAGVEWGADTASLKQIYVLDQIVNGIWKRSIFGL